MGFDQERFNEFIADAGVYGFFEEPITLKSGRTSHYYANWRNVAEDAYLMDQLTDFVLEFVADHNIHADTFYGVPEGATKLGIITQFKHAKQQESFGQGSHTLAMGRGKPKEHGMAKDRYFLGVPSGRVVVLEDVTTTGGSLLENLQALLDAGIIVEGVISLTNRMELRPDGKSVKQVIEEQGVHFYSMSSATQLLPRMCEKLQPADSVRQALMDEFEQHGVERLRL